MDPLSLILVVLLGLVAGQGSRVGYRKHVKRRREAMREALLHELHVTGHRLSIFDLCWDLGASEFSLEIMASRGLLPEHPQQLRLVHQSLREQIEDHGSYEALIQDLLESIQVVYDEHRRAGHRRQLPTMRLDAVKLLPAPDGESGAAGGEPAGAGDASSQALTRRDPSEPSAPGSPDGQPDPWLELGWAQRAHWRQSRVVGQFELVHDSQGQVSVDIDRVLTLSPGALLQSMWRGGFWREASRWMQLKQLRALRKELDRALERLYHFFESLMRQDPELLSALYDPTRRWRQEQERIERQGRERPWRARPWALAADVLMEEARIMARYLADHARKNADDAILQLRQHVLRGDLAMAGYLVYINRYAFLAGCRQDYSALVNAVEVHTYKIQQELGALRARGVL